MEMKKIIFYCFFTLKRFFTFLVVFNSNHYLWHNIMKASFSLKFKYLSLYYNMINSLRGISTLSLE